MVMVQPNKETIFTLDFLFFFPWLDRGNADEMPTSEECGRGGVRPPTRPLMTSL